MVFFLIWLLFGIACSMIAGKKGRDGCGWFLIGMLLGPFGLLFAFIVDDKTPVAKPGVVRDSPTGSPRWEPDEAEKRCPDCQETIKLKARVCRFCQRQFSDEEVGQQVADARSGFERAHPLDVWRGRRCPRCDRRNIPDLLTCRSCRTDLSDVPVTTEPE